MGSSVPGGEPEPSLQRRDSLSVTEGAVPVLGGVGGGEPLENEALSGEGQSSVQLEDGRAAEDGDPDSAASRW